MYCNKTNLGHLHSPFVLASPSVTCAQGSGPGFVPTAAGCQAVKVVFPTVALPGDGDFRETVVAQV